MKYRGLSCNDGFPGWYSGGDMCFPEDPCQDVPDIAVFDATPIVYGPETGQGGMIWGNPRHLHEWGDGYQTPYGYFWYTGPITGTITEQHGTSNEVSPVPLMGTLGLLLSALLMSAAFLPVYSQKPTNPLDPGKDRPMKTTKTTSMILAASMTLAGCATNPDNIQATSKSPMTYRGLSCNEMNMEAQRISDRLTDITGQQRAEASKDAVAMTVGMLVFWPALFFMMGDDHKDEIATLRGEAIALQSAANAKGC